MRRLCTWGGGTLCTWRRYVYEVIMFMRTLCSWGRCVSEDIRDKVRVRVRVRVRHRVSVRHLMSDVNRQEISFQFHVLLYLTSSMSHILFYTHTEYFGQKVVCLVWKHHVYAYFMYTKLGIRTLWPCKHLRNISKVYFLTKSVLMILWCCKDI